MKTGVLSLVGACILGAILAAQSQSQPQSDNEPLDLKSYGCEQHLDLVDLEDGRSEIVTVWAHGYYNGLRGVDENTPTETWTSVEAFSEQLLKICEREPEKLFIAVVKDVARAKPASQP